MASVFQNTLSLFHLLLSSPTNSLDLNTKGNPLNCSSQSQISDSRSQPIIIATCHSNSSFCGMTQAKTILNYSQKSRLRKRPIHLQITPMTMAAHVLG